MLQGAISFQTRIKSNGVRFPLVEVNSNVCGVGKIEIEAPNGHEIHATVHLTSVASPQEGRELAAKAHQVVLDRIAFNHGVAIENPRRTGEQYSPPVAVDAFADVGARLGVVLGIDPAQLRDELEQPSPPGERNYGLFRSARQSLSPVEEFMHLYNILLMLHCDKQRKVDDFIRREEPKVCQTPSPKYKCVKETVYSKLRNDFGHASRTGGPLDKTKSDMAAQLDRLRAHTKRAIELHP
jgi:hypothetical protein